MNFTIDAVVSTSMQAVRRGLSLFALLALLAVPVALLAQTAGEGTITGTVTDSSGAVVAGATVTATNVATNISTTRTSTSSGAYTIAPIPAGIYSVQIAAKGFKTLRQDNLSVNALAVLSFNAALTLGEATETVVVTAAPPVLDTSNATLGTVIEHETYTNLPIQMSGIQRDPTDFAKLTPGAQTSTGRLPLIGGTGNYLQQLYLEGIPAETINQQGDNRVVSLNVDIDAVDQFQIVSSVPPVEYSGAGAENFTMKSGGLKYHGQASDYVRNTIFDNWSFVNKWAQAVGINPDTGVKYPTCSAGTSSGTDINGQTVNYASRAGCQAKPFEHQNEMSFSIGGKVPLTHDKLFFFVAYDKFHYRAYAVPALATIPTTLMRTGDFTELNANAVVGTGYTGITGNPAGTGNVNPAIIYDPTSNACVGTVCTRTPFQGLKNGLPTFNVIPTGYISPITQAMQAFLPAPTYTNVITNNYLGTRVAGFDNHVTNYRVDYDLSAKNRLSAVGAIGVEDYYNNFAAPYIPLPYEGGDLASVFPKQFVVEDVYTVNANVVNQLKYGYTRFFQNIVNSTDGVSKWDAPAFNITNLPPGLATTTFPGAAFSTNTAISPNPSTWTGNTSATSTQPTTPNSYTIVDNLLWTKGKHALTFGFTYQFLEVNAQLPATYSGGLYLNYNAVTTANYNANSSALGTNSGYGYASYLLGGVGGTPTLAIQPVPEIGSRYKPFAPYVSDNFKLSQKLTIDMGIRWDYLPPYHEVNNHFSFLNPTLTGITGQPAGAVGALQLAGNYGGAGVGIGNKTPANTYWKNFGPRVGLAYSVDDKTVIRMGIGMVYSFGGGSGGGRTSNGGSLGQGQSLGFNLTATGTPELTSGLAAGPSFFLNNGPYFTGIGKANTALFGGTALPTAPTLGPATQLLNMGNYLNTSGAIVTAGSMAYVDPYATDRAPEFTFFNFGFERGVTKDMTLAVNYVGSESHHAFEYSAGTNSNGYWVNQLNPVYLAALGNVLDSTGTKPILTAAATSANIAKAQTVLPNITIPSFFSTAANAFPSSTTVTLAQGLTAFPQYSSINNGWGSNVQNFAYNSLQITLSQRESHGLSFNINYTFSKNIGDDSTFRSGYDIPAAAVSGNGQAWKQDRIDRTLTTTSQPEVVNAYGVYKLPFGEGHRGGNSLWMRTLTSGWLLSGTYQYFSGLPLVVTWSGGCANAAPNPGTCMPDVNTASPDFTSKNARINGSYGTGPNGTVAGNLGLAGGTAIKYVDYNAFKIPTDISAVTGQTTHQYLIGNAPRTAALGLRSPGSQVFNAGLHRSFALREGMSIMFEADCFNVWNKVTFSAPGGGWSATASQTSNTYGEVTGIASNPAPRDWSFGGHFIF